MHLIEEFQRIEGEIRKPSSVINAKKWRKTTEWERLEISSRKLEIPRVENPRDCGAWWAAVYGVAQSRTRLKRFSSLHEIFPWYL